MKKRRIKPSDYITENRRILRIGHACYLNIPAESVETHHLKHEDKVSITANHLLKVIPCSEN